MDVITSGKQPIAARLDLTPLLPSWARTDIDSESPSSPEAVSALPDGHYPTLPLPPAVSGATVLLVMALGVRVWRQLKGRADFR